MKLLRTLCTMISYYFTKVNTIIQINKNTNIFFLLVIFTLGIGFCVYRRQYSAFLQINFLPNENLIRPLKGAMGVKMKDQSLHAFPLYLIPKALNIYFYKMYCCSIVHQYCGKTKFQATDIFKLVFKFHENYSNKSYKICKK